MFCPDSSDTVVSREDMLSMLISIHGKDVSKWPSKVPEDLKILAETILISRKNVSEQP